METVLANAYVPIILDADGLNTIAAFPELTNYFTENIIVTPHLGEMARLTGSSVETIRGCLIPTAREYADRYGITCVLKDAVTVAALKDQRTYINTSGNSAMAKAGAGGCPDRNYRRTFGAWHGGIGRRGHGCIPARTSGGSGKASVGRARPSGPGTDGSTGRHYKIMRQNNLKEV